MREHVRKRMSRERANQERKRNRRTIKKYEAHRNAWIAVATVFLYQYKTGRLIPCQA